MWQRIRNYFLTGLVVLAPVGITIYLTWLFIDSVDGLVDRMLPGKYHPESYLPIGVPGLGVLIAFILITLFGALTANFFGRQMIGLGERLFDKMPVVRSIYSTLKQIAETAMAQSSTTFRDVVLIEYPRKGLWSLAFVSSTAKGEIQEKTDDHTLNIFLPTTPNPTSGYLLFVPKQDCIFLDMTVEQAVKYVISAGLVAPAEMEGERPRKVRVGDVVVDAVEGGTAKGKPANGKA